MIRKAFARNIRTVGAVLVASALLPAASLAQSDFPSGAAFRAGMGSHGYFDVSAGQSHPIATLDQTETYRVCIIGKRGKLIVNNKDQVPLDNGDCHDASGKSFSFEADGGDGETQGYYRHLRRHR